jgi:hypothetical protein
MTPGRVGEAAQLVLLFGSRGVLKEQHHLDEIKQAYPRAHLLGCSTAGEIYATQVCDDSLVATAIQFEATPIEGVRVKLSDGSRSFAAGERLAKGLDKAGLVHVFVLSDGLHVNGSELVEGLAAHLPPMLPSLAGSQAMCSTNSMASRPSRSIRPTWGSRPQACRPQACSSP